MTDQTPDTIETVPAETTDTGTSVIPEQHRQAFYAGALMEFSEAIKLASIMVLHPRHGNGAEIRMKIIAHLRKAILYFEDRRET